MHLDFMTFQTLLNRIFGLNPPQLPGPIGGLCHPDELEEVIRRERSRADRTGGEFAVITFSSSAPQRDPNFFRPLIKHLQDRSRAVDELGWNHDGTLWHILSNCSKEAAASIATRLCNQFSAVDAPMVFTLYHYATNEPRTPSPIPLAPSMAPQTLPAENFQRSYLSEIQLGGECVAAVETEIREELPSCHTALPVEQLLERPLPRWKRAFDVVAAAIALIVFAPLFAIIALSIKLTSPGPVLFVQLRSGRGGRAFRMFKFRSMFADAEERKQSLLALNEQDGPAFKMENDPRITKVGRWLRASSLDELPQLWNVLRGDMSLVGPRPLPIAESDACEKWQRQRLEVTPGLTCFWQIKDRRAKIPFVDWARMDIRYAAKRSLWLDLHLIARTVLFILRRKGV